MEFCHGRNISADCSAPHPPVIKMASELDLAVVVVFVCAVVAIFLVVEVEVVGVVVVVVALFDCIQDKVYNTV